MIANAPASAIVDFVPGIRKVHLINPGHATSQQDHLVVPGLPIEALNRTFVNIALGRDWYLFQPAHTYLSCLGGGCGGNGCNDCGGLTWRVGIDGGARYGTAKLDLHGIQAPNATTGTEMLVGVRHRTDTIAGAFVAVHSDVEYPCGCCTFQAGIRFEWDYTWMDILQEQNNTDVQDLNLLFTLGARF